MFSTARRVLTPSAKNLPVYVGVCTPVDAAMQGETEARKVTGQLKKEVGFPFYKGRRSPTDNPGGEEPGPHTHPPPFPRTVLPMASPVLDGDCKAGV